MRALTGTFIGFCGAGGTGKTTTAEALLTELGDTWKLLPSTSRDTFRQMGLNREDDQDRLSPLDRWTLQRNIQIAHSEKVKPHRDQQMITDRTQLDQFAYALQYCNNILNLSDLKWLEDLTAKSLEFYAHIFYFPLTSFKDHSDGMRTHNLATRLSFDLLLKGLIGNLEVPITSVPIMTVHNRVQFIRNTLLAKSKTP
jgi:hypothetical protein